MMTAEPSLDATEVDSQLMDVSNSHQTEMLCEAFKFSDSECVCAFYLHT